MPNHIKGVILLKRTNPSIRLAAALLAVVMLFTLLPVLAQAASSGDYEYTVNTDGTATITRYTGTGVNVVVPATIDGYRVRDVGQYAFHGVQNDLDSIRSITFSEGIQSVWPYAIYVCENLETISLPSTLTGFSVPTDNCEKVTEIKFPKGNSNVTVKDKVVYNKDMTSLLYYPPAKTGERFVVPSSVKRIGSDSFAQQQYLKEVVLPDSVTEIGYWAFTWASKLEKINIPKSCKVVGQFAFSTTSIRSLHIPASMEMFMSDNVPDTLEKVTVDSASKRYKAIDNALYQLDEEGNPIYLMLYCPSSIQEELILPDTVTNIIGDAFGQFSDNLRYLDLGSSITELEYYILPRSLRALVVPTSLERISESFCFHRIQRLYYEGTEEQWNAIEGVADVGIKHPVHFNVKDAKTHSTSYAYTAPSCAYSATESFTCPCGWDWTEEFGILDCIWGPWEMLTDDPNPPRWFSYARYCTRCGRQMAYYSGEMPLNPFTDVPDDSFYGDAVRWANYKGITTGTSATTFNPADPCMRAHVVTFLWRAAGSPEPTITENPFVDVKETDFFYKSVLWAVENGITGGIDTTHFGPAEYCNRAQVVTFLYQTMNSPEVTGAENPFADVPADTWYTTPVLWAVQEGITSGLSADTFGPGSVCNRAQIVLFLFKAFGWD